MPRVPLHRGVLVRALQPLSRSGAGGRDDGARAGGILPMTFDLSRISTPDLRHLCEQLRRSPGFTAADLASWGLGHLPLPRAGAAELLAAVESALAERQRPDARVELIWTGPETAGSTARDTAVV